MRGEAELCSRNLGLQFQLCHVLLWDLERGRGLPSLSVLIWEPLAVEGVAGSQSSGAARALGSVHRLTGVLCLVLEVCGPGAGGRRRRTLLPGGVFHPSGERAAFLPSMRVWMDILLPSDQRGVPIPIGLPPHGQLSTMLALHGGPEGSPPCLSHSDVPSLRGGLVSRPDPAWAWDPPAVGAKCCPSCQQGPRRVPGWAILASWHRCLAFSGRPLRGTRLPGGGLWAQLCMLVVGGGARLRHHRSSRSSP